MKGIIEIGHGHYDYQEYVADAAAFYKYFDASPTGDYNYSGDGTFVEAIGIGDYDRSITGYALQESTTEIDAEIDTVDYRFIESLSSAPLKLFIKSAISLGLLELQYASDTNYIENSATLQVPCGTTEETSSFSNTNVRLAGTKQVKDNAVNFGQAGARNSSALRLKMSFPTDTNRIDDIIIHGIQLVGDNLYFEGGDNAQSRT